MRIECLPDFLNLVSQPCERLIHNITIITLNCKVLSHKTIQIYIIRFQPIKIRLFGFQNYKLQHCDKSMYLQCGITTCSQQGLVSGYLHDYSFHSVALLQSGCHGSSLQDSTDKSSFKTERQVSKFNAVFSEFAPI